MKTESDLHQVSRYLTPLLSAYLFCMFTVVPAAMADVVLIRDGKPVAKIYTSWKVVRPAEKELKNRRWRSANADALAHTALLDDLNYHLKQMSGAELEVVTTTDAGAIKGVAVVLGSLAVDLGATPQKTTKSMEGVRIITRGDRLLIGGESDEAVGHGIYALLSKLGCDWVMPGKIGEHIPTRKTITVPAMDDSQSPDFQYRRLWYRGYNQPRLPEERERFAQWNRRQRGGGNMDPIIGNVGGHVWAGFIKRHKDEFEKDPTMLALRRGKDGSLQRLGPQLESSHPRVVELFIQDIKDAFKKNIESGAWTKETSAGFGIGPADGLGYSNSAEEQLAGSGRIDPVVGELDRTDHLILLGNRILEEVHKEYPNAHVGFYSYSTHADYPSRYKPNPKIVQIFAPINFSRYHSALDSNSKTQSYYREVVEQWGRLSREQGNPLIYRGYNWNLAENLLPFTKVRIWGEELPWYKENGIIGLNVEATKAWNVNGPSDYVFMKLAWDTSLKWQEVLKDYCRKSFGAGAETMESYLLSVMRQQHESGQEAGSYHAMHLIYNHAWVVDALKLLDRAKKEASTDADKTRVQNFRYGVEVLKLYLDYHQASLQFDFVKARQLYDAMQAHWKMVYDINTDLVANESPYYLKRFIVRFIDEGLKYSTAPYRMVARIPDELTTMFDPNEIGHRMNYQSPAINDSGFVKTKTISTTWDAQGLTGIRSGAVWYRHRFNLPQDAKGQPVGLFIGGVEDTANVWINGKLVGSSGRAFSRPFLFDLTDGISYDSENLLAIQVIRDGKANEIGLGGIIRPSFVFTGPQLPEKSPKQIDLRRVLPGGELGGEEQ